MIENDTAKKIIVLGAGISGLTAAERLARRYGDKVLVLEKNNFVGGLAATRSHEGLKFDLGSHRIHGAVSSKVYTYLNKTLGVNLHRRPRRGILYFRGKYFNYPPNLLNLLKVVTLKRSVGYVLDYFKTFRHPRNYDNYQDLILKRVGKKIYTIFYKDFARKLWGVDPQKIAVEGIRRRGIPTSIAFLIRSFNTKNRYFFYPSYGIGEIAARLEEKIYAHHGKVLKTVIVKRFTLQNGKITHITIEDEKGIEQEIEVSLVVSTIPIDEVYRLFFAEEAPSLTWRDVRLFYVHIDETLKHNNETFYFPSLDITIGRVSDIGKYSPHLNPGLKGTLLTIEIPAFKGDGIWKMDSGALLELCLNDLLKTKILEKYPKVVRYFTFELEKAYPVYAIGWRERFFLMYDKLIKIPNLFIIGRKGLFLHCNIDHCIIQGLTLADFIAKGSWGNKQLWNKKAAEFFSFSARD